MGDSSRSSSPTSARSTSPAFVPIIPDSEVESGFISKSRSHNRSVDPESSTESEPPVEDFNVPPEPRDTPLFVSFFGLGVRPLSQSGDKPGDDKLFWLRAAVQNSGYWFFVDTGSATNIIDKNFYFSLPFHPAPSPSDPRERLISGHNTALPVIGEVVLPFILHNKQYYHLFRVVENFPVDLCLGADFMKAHECCLSYEKGRNVFQIKKISCPTCSENFSRVSTQAKKVPVLL